MAEQPTGVPTWARALIALVVIGFVLLIVGFWRGGQPETATSDPPVAESRTEVQWGDYDGSVKIRIDELEAAQDCSGLQAEFDTADQNSATTLERTGHGNGQLMSYIDEALEAAGCYTP